MAWVNRAAPKSMKFCPLCADIVLSSTGQCVKKCEWPPPETAIGSAPPQGACWAEGISTDVLESSLASLRRTQEAIQRELEIRRAASASSRGAGLQVMLREIGPARFPREAACSEDVERLAVACCNLALRDARDFLAEAGFIRIPRVIRGRNAWLYQYRFDPEGTPSFVRLTVRRG